jgi:hypothetical protein
MDAMRVFVLCLLVCAVAAEGQFTQQTAPLRAVDVLGASVGRSVAISADGNTAIAGGPTDRSLTGAAWIFTRNGKIWSQQGPRLHGTGAIADQAQQGSAVAISADGNTALVGGPRDRCDCAFDGTYPGATWVFTRVAGVWSQQGTKLFGGGAIGSAEQGSSLALSADGNTAIIGGPSDNSVAGAAWIFTRSGDSWSQQAKLVPFSVTGSSARGFSVALSGDGNTAIIGAPSGTDGGAAWIFTRTGGVWTQQTQLLALGAIGAFPRYGASVALSYDGSTAIVGSPGDSSDFGAVWVYTRALNEWSQQGGKLVGSTENPGGRQGTSVSLSADGNTAVSGGYLDSPRGGVWVFTRNELGVWSQQGSKLVGTTVPLAAGEQGRAVAISADATTFVEGGASDEFWPFAKAVPTIATLSGNGQSAQINAAFPPLTVIVRDAADQPSSDASVTFTIHVGPNGASATFASSATVVTNANGIATAPTLTANGNIGGFTATATTAAVPATATFDLANAAIATPTNVTATATPSPTIVVNWSPVSGATMYEVMRSTNLVEYTSRTTTSGTSFIDASQIFNFTTSLYKVRVVEPALSGFSAPDLATTMSFTDSALDGVKIKAAHVTELRQAMNILRGFSGLDSPMYTDPSLNGLPVKAIHLTELRAALDEARGRMMLPAVLYTRPAITAGWTGIAGADVIDLRSGVE